MQARNSKRDGDGDKVADGSNMMFVVVRNLKSQPQQQNEANVDGSKKNSFAHDHRLARGDTIKLGRLKFNVKDFRTADQPANLDLKKQGVIDRSASPVRQRYKIDDGEDSENEYHEEEAIEIDCGVVGTHAEDGTEIQCKVCWGNE